MTEMTPAPRFRIEHGPCGDSIERIDDSSEGLVECPTCSADVRWETIRISDGRCPECPDDGIRIKLLDTGYWHARGDGPCNWAQWRKGTPLRDEDFFCEAGDSFRNALRERFPETET